MSRRPEIAIVTANFGGIDQVQPQEPQNIGVEWIYHTDSPTLEAPGWNVIRHTPNGTHPCLAAKKFKLAPPVPHRFAIWVDANIRIQSKHFAREALGFIRDGLAVHAHPFRDCIYEEALETQITPKYHGLPIKEQVAHYRREYPIHGGLYACGVIAWDRANPAVEQLGKAWLHECQRWSFQDQLSFPVICKRLGIQPGVFPHEQYRSPWFRIFPHLR